MTSVSYLAKGVPLLNQPDTRIEKRRILLTPTFGAFTPGMEETIFKFSPEVGTIKDMRADDKLGTVVHIRRNYISRQRDKMVSSAYESVLYVKEPPEGIRALMHEVGFGSTNEME